MAGRPPDVAHYDKTGTRILIRQRFSADWVFGEGRIRRLLVGVTVPRLRPHRWAATMAIVPLLASYAVGAQQPAAPSPVMQHYRAYRAALDQGNLQTAEAEAASALAASIEQNGDGGRTAVLAVNLAGVRLALKENAAAVEPARRALAIAEARGAASGVDVHVARLILRRAELPDGGAAALDRLQQAVTEAQGVTGIEGEAYPAAVELAVAAYANGRYQVSRDAWVASGKLADGCPVNSDYARAKAKLGEAAAAIMQHAKDAAKPQIGSRLRPAQEFAQIDAMLAEAMDIIHDQAMESEAGGELTLAQSVFGQAQAWKKILHAKLYSEGRALPTVAQPQKLSVELGAPDNSRAVCRTQTVVEPPPVFPHKQRVVDGVGAVALKLLVDEAGKVTRVQVAGSVGGQAFTDSVVAAARQWHVKKLDGSPADCSMAKEFFMTVEFRYQ